MNEIPPILTPQKDKSSGETKRFGKLAGIAGIFFLIGLFCGLTFSKMQLLYAKSQQVQVVNMLRSFQYPQDLSNAQQYCTKKGFEVLTGFTQDGVFLKTYNPPQLFAVKINGDSCDVELTRDNVEGASVVSVRLLKENGWKFEDIYLKKINNRELGYWFSDYQTSPAFYTALAYRHDIASGIQNTADTIEQLNKIGKELDQLFGDKSSESTETNSLTPSDF